MRFGESQLPGKSRVLDARARAGTRTAVVAGDENHVRAAFGNARRDGADARLGDELDVDARVGVRILKVEDQLRQILDRIDIVVRRR